MPSRMSPVVETRPNSVASNPWPSASVIWPPLFTASMMKRAAIGGLAREHAGKTARLGHELGSGNDPIHQPDPVRLLRADRVTRQHQLERATGPDETWQPLAAAVTGNQPEIDLWLSELRGVGGQTDRAGHGELAASTQRIAIDRGDDRLPEILEQVEDVLPPQRVVARARRRLLRQFVDVGSGHERLVSGTRQDDAANGRVVPQVQNRAAKLVERFGVERVEHLGPVDRHDSSRAVALDQQIHGVGVLEDPMLSALIHSAQAERHESEVYLQAECPSSVTFFVQFFTYAIASTHATPRAAPAVSATTSIASGVRPGVKL